MGKCIFRFLSAAVLFVVLASSAFAGSARTERVGVRQLMQNVEQYNADVQVEGIVSRIYPARGMLGLIGVQEYADCSSVSCAKLILPVSWEGEMPEITDHLLVHGEIRNTNGKKVFVAESLKRIEGSDP